MFIICSKMMVEPREEKRQQHGEAYHLESDSGE